MDKNSCKLLPEKYIYDQQIGKARAGIHIFFTNPHSPTRSSIIIHFKIVVIYPEREIQSEGRTASQLTLAPGSEWTQWNKPFIPIYFSLIKLYLLKVFGALHKTDRFYLRPGLLAVGLDSLHSMIYHPSRGHDDRVLAQERF